MAISDAEYEDFQKKIAARDAADVQRAIEVVETAIESFKATCTAVRDLRDSLPPNTSFTQSNARGNLENLYAQVTGFDAQLGYTRDSLKSIAEQYSNYVDKAEA
jgi:hypothetical protein